MKNVLMIILTIATLGSLQVHAKNNDPVVPSQELQGLIRDELIKKYKGDFIHMPSIIHGRWQEFQECSGSEGATLNCTYILDIAHCDLGSPDEPIIGNIQVKVQTVKTSTGYNIVLGNITQKCE